MLSNESLDLFGLREPPGHSQQNCTVICRAISVQPQYGHFIAGQSAFAKFLSQTLRRAASQQVINPQAEHGSDLRQMPTNLASASGFPLGDSTPCYAHLLRQSCLREAETLPRCADSISNFNVVSELHICISSQSTICELI